MYIPVNSCLLFIYNMYDMYRFWRFCQPLFFPDTNFNTLYLIATILAYDWSHIMRGRSLVQGQGHNYKKTMLKFVKKSCLLMLNQIFFVSLSWVKKLDLGMLCRMVTATLIMYWVCEIFKVILEHVEVVRITWKICWFGFISILRSYRFCSFII